MKLEEVRCIVQGDIQYCHDSAVEIEVGFASDLMSDALALIQQNHEKTILITGLCNSQSIRSADMLDIKTILIVRGKKYKEEDIALAKDCGINVISTNYTMFEAVGRLYVKGIKNV